MSRNCMLLLKEAIMFNERPVQPIKDKQNPIRPCMSPSHNPPMQICIRPGETFVHKCPACGQKTEIIGPQYTC